MCAFQVHVHMHVHVHVHMHMHMCIHAHACVERPALRMATVRGLISIT